MQIRAEKEDDRDAVYALNVSVFETASEAGPELTVSDSLASQRVTYS